MKWCEISHLKSVESHPILSEYLHEKGLPNTYEWLESDSSNLAEMLSRAKEGFDQIRIGPPHGGTIFSHFQHMGAFAQRLQAADHLIYRSQKWWLESALFRAFTELFNIYGEKLDLESRVMIVGSGAAARVAVAASVQLGFKRLSLTSTFDEEARVLLSKMKKTFFSVDFQFVSQDRLVLLPGSHCLAVNTTPFSEQNEVLKELYYFNFLEPGGMVWDLSLEREATPLVRLAGDFGATVIDGMEIRSHLDEAWLESCGLDSSFKFDRVEFLEKLREKMGQTLKEGSDQGRVVDPLELESE